MWEGCKIAAMPGGDFPSRLMAATSFYVVEKYLEATDKAGKAYLKSRGVLRPLDDILPAS